MLKWGPTKSSVLGYLSQILLLRGLLMEVSITHSHFFFISILSQFSCARVCRVTLQLSVYCSLYLLEQFCWSWPFQWILLELIEIEAAWIDVLSVTAIIGWQASESAHQSVDETCLGKMYVESGGYWSRGLALISFLSLSWVQFVHFLIRSQTESDFFFCLYVKPEQLLTPAFLTFSFFSVSLFHDPWCCFMMMTSPLLQSFNQVRKVVPFFYLHLVHVSALKKIVLQQSSCLFTHLPCQEFLVFHKLYTGERRKSWGWGMRQIFPHCCLFSGGLQ